MRIWLAWLIIVVLPAAAQQPQAAPAISPQERIRAVMEEAAARQNAAVSGNMEASLAKQREAIHTQASTAAVAIQPSESDFLLMPFPPPVSPLMPTAQGSAACDPLPSAELDPLISQSAERNGVSPALIREVVRKESGFRPCAESSKGAQGLMQLMPATQEQFQVGDPFDPGQNVEGGSKLLRYLLDRYQGDLALALAAYNAGAGRVDRAGGIPPIPETHNYVSDVVRRVPDR